MIEWNTNMDEARWLRDCLLGNGVYRVCEDGKRHHVPAERLVIGEGGAWAAINAPEPRAD